jgi:hypothetical protein
MTLRPRAGGLDVLDLTVRRKVRSESRPVLRPVSLNRRASRITSYAAGQEGSAGGIEPKGVNGRGPSSVIRAVRSGWKVHYKLECQIEGKPSYRLFASLEAALAWAEQVRADVDDLIDLEGNTRRLQRPGLDRAIKDTAPIDAWREMRGVIG